MKIRIVALVCGLLLSFGMQAGTNKDGNTYSFTLDLTNVVDDKLFVELSAPSINQDEITYYLPKIIPGTYSIEDYGLYVSEFTAYDKKGNQLEVEKIDLNGWKIKKAKKLVKITYWVEDTYDTQIEEAPYIFEPSGTNIESGKNFVINTPGFFGYFEGMKDNPFNFNIIRSKDMYGSTGLIPDTDFNNLTATLKKESKEENEDLRVDSYTVEDYNRMVDSPLMYCKPDTAIIKVANTEVLISTYSPNDVISAKEVAEQMREVLMAQKEYLGGELPVEKYAFIMYFTTRVKKLIGALEHSYSSMYFLPERDIETLKGQMRTFAAHEFFHIVTPLNIHSEEIGDFDFNEPKMSKHLWLYEGITEFFAGNMQVKYDLISEEQYLDVIRQKLNRADAYYDSVPFTDISRYTLDKYPEQYPNVYEKGALIGMCLDILLRDLSDGKYGVQNLLRDLSKKYGKDQSFKDENLFDEIEKMTYPEVGTFLRAYIGGSESLPIKEILGKVGVNYVESEEFMALDFGINQAGLGFNGKEGTLYVKNTDALSEFGRMLGFKNGDIILEINNDALPAFGPEFMSFIGQKQEEITEGEPYSYLVRRDGEEVKLETVAVKIKQFNNHVLTFNENATERQLMLRKSWLKP